MSEDIKIFRIAEKTKDGKIKLKSEFTETISIDDLNDKYINTYNNKSEIENNLNLLKAKINRLSKEVKETDELKEFANKLKDIEKIKEKENCIEQAKKWEKSLEVMEKDLIQLRRIQIDLDLNK